MIENKMIKAAAAVPSLKVADAAYNTQQIIKLMQANRDIGVLVFPELSLCGYTCADLLNHDLLLDACLEGLRKIT